MDKLSYKGYLGSIEVSVEDYCMHGRIQFIDDIITYEGETIKELEESFKQSVDRYLKYCEETGKSPNKPYSGTFNVRIGQDLHKMAAEVAWKQNLNMNEFIIKSIKEAINKDGVVKVECNHYHTIRLTDRYELTAFVNANESPSSWREGSAVIN